MIFSKVAELFFTLITGLLNGINLPSLPDTFSEYITTFFSLVNLGTGLFCYFMPVDLIKVLFPIWIALAFADEIYKLIMWILAKIPMADIH